MMKLIEVLESLRDLLGQRLTVEAVIHSDTVNVWLNEQARSEDEQIVVDDARIAGLFLATIPPRLGGRFGYYFDSILSGKLSFDRSRGIPVISDVDSLEIIHNGTKRKLI